MKKKYLRLLAAISFFLLSTSIFAHPNACLSLNSFFSVDQSYAFQGSGGTLNQLGGLVIYISPDYFNKSVYGGFLSYYNGAFGNDINGTCTDNGDGTGKVSITSSLLGSIKAVIQITSDGPILHVISTSLANHDGGYSNVSGDTVLSPYNPVQDKAHA